jgi:uncharacterized protein
MKMTGSQTIPAPRAVVWKGLNDPSVLQKCIPGCDKITAISPTNFKATMVAKVGPVKATFSGEVHLTEIDAPKSYRISGQGEGGFAGFANGGATVKLTEISATETLMDYDVDAQIGGKLAMLGSRLIDSTAQSLATQFFTKFATLMKETAKSIVAKAPAKKMAIKKPAKKVAVKKIATKKSPAKKAVTKKAPAKKAPTKKAAKKK